MDESKIHYIHSSRIAKQRLDNMKQREYKNTERLFNHYPPDNNQLWEKNHNPLSSKGD